MYNRELIVDGTTSDIMHAHDACDIYDDYIEIAYWSNLHQSWILHKKFKDCDIRYNGYPIPCKSKAEAAKLNQSFKPNFYGKTNKQRNQ